MTGSLLAAATSVINEAAPTANHSNRLAYANAILVNPWPQAQFLLPGMLTNPTLQGMAGGTNTASGTCWNDSDVDYVIASLFNEYANQYVAQNTVGAALSLGTAA